MFGASFIDRRCKGATFTFAHLLERDDSNLLANATNQQM
jgi:hypothetical protein